MDRYTRTEKIIRAGLLAALTCIATFAIKIPTPQGGYVHLGDGFVLACGFLLGPLYGTLAAGLGSALADLVSGYVAFTPATFVIKCFTALFAALLYRLLTKHFPSKKAASINTIFAGCLGEAVMIIGYYAYNTLLLFLSSSVHNRQALITALLSSLTIIPFDLLQGAFGIVTTTLLSPILSRLIKNTDR